MGDVCTALPPLAQPLAVSRTAMRAAATGAMGDDGTRCSFGGGREWRERTGGGYIMGQSTRLVSSSVAKATLRTDKGAQDEQLAEAG